MKIVATLACRNNSTRLYGKPLQMLGKNSIVEYMVERLRERKEINDIVLAISEMRGNEAFIDLAEKNNLNYILGDDGDVLNRLIKACEFAGGDTVYRVTTESPFTYLEGLPQAVKTHKEKGVDYTSFAKLPDGVTFELIKLEALKVSHKQGDARHRSELCALYINEHPELFTKNILQVDTEWQRPDYRLTIDYPEDLILCRKIIAALGDNKYIPYVELMDFLDVHPELRGLVENLTDLNYVKPYH